MSPAPRLTIRRSPPWLAWPALSWYALFLVAPLLIVIVYSIAQKGTYGGVVYDWSMVNFVRAFDTVYLRIFGNSIVLALLTSIACLVIGYPMAYVMATSSPRTQKILMTLVVIPFWTNFVVRAYAIKIVLLEGGPVSQWLGAIGLSGQPVAFGMVTNYLPFMVLPLFTSIEKFDFALLEAARDLGASSFSVFRRVLLPQTLPGVVTGVIFVFTPALGEFVIPDLLGGAKTMLIGNLITEQFLKTRDWPFGAALSVLLIAVVMVSLQVYLRYGREPEART